jgi:hypothetical protein
MEKQTLHMREDKVDVKIISYMREGGVGGRRNTKRDSPAAPQGKPGQPSRTQQQ